MKRINEIVVVEGKTDSQLLKELYDVDTIETHGLGLDDKTLELIKEASKTRGVIVLTDPDYPGLRIRNQVEKYVQNCKHAFVDRKDAIGKKKLGIAEANKEAVKKAIENVVTFSNQEESISWKEFLELDIIGDKKKRLKIYDLFHLGYGNAKTLFKRLNMVGISREMIPEVEVSEIEGYKSAGIIAGGMIPKIGGMADAIYQGVHEAVIIDGRVPHSILLELFSDRGSGTRFYRRSHRE